MAALMKLLFLLLLSFCISPSAEAISDEELENLVFQSDYIALVRIADVSVDSLPYFVHDLGTNHYSANFETVEVFKQSVSNPGNSYNFVYVGYEKPGKDQYRQAEFCYLFLSTGLPKLLQGREVLNFDDLSFSRLNLLKGGLIPENELKKNRLKHFTEPSEFAKHAMKGHTKALKRAAKAFIAERNKKNLLDKTIQISISEWLLRFKGIDGVMADSCVAHILIWPGWSNHFFWVNTPDGLKEYDLRITHGRHTRFRMPAFYRNQWKVDYVKESPGARESVIRQCKEEHQNQKIDTYNNLIQFRLDEGRLNWSVVGAPKHEDSQYDLMRVKLLLYNRSDSAMYVRWPGNQNYGKPLITFVLEEEKTNKRYFQSSRDFNFPMGEAIPPKNHLLAAGDTVSHWFSINDLFQEYSDVSAIARFYDVAEGRYRLLAIYKPYPEETKDSVCWHPSFDSLSAYAGYVFNIEKEVIDSFKVKGEILHPSGDYVNEYDQKGFYHAIMRVDSGGENFGITAGMEIAWKILLPPEVLAGDEFRPPFTHEILKPGDHVEVDLISTRKGGMINTDFGTFRLYGTPSRIDIVKILKE
jgi:hypothetical protein